MKKFLYRLLFFLTITILPLAFGVFMPATPYASKSLIFGNLLKDSLMKNVESPRIIFLGGSNLSFGLNSQLIKDSLKLNPINAGIHASIGLIYMLSNSLEFIKKGDIVVLVPEYQQFYGDAAFGSEGEELTRTIFDVNKSKIKLLKPKQIINILKRLPKYSISKFKISEYRSFKEREIYSVHSFNTFGDTYKHWGLKREEFKQFGNLGNNLNQDVFDAIKEYQKEIERRKAVLLLSYPGYQDLSYQNSIESIKAIENEMKRSGLKAISSPERYMIPDSLIFNTPYHLTKKGVDYRTNLLIADLKKILKNGLNSNTSLIQ